MDSGRQPLAGAAAAAGQALRVRQQVDLGRHYQELPATLDLSN